MMETGFEKANSTNLPVVSMDMIHDFYMSNLDYFAPEIKGAKLIRSTKETYGDKDIGYVQLKRDMEKCVLKCKVTPEHRISKKAYNCNIIINESNSEIEVCKCDDCAASEGGCKHAVAFLYWLHRRSEEPAVTEVKSYWQKSKLSDSKKQFLICTDFPGTLQTPTGLCEDFLNKVLPMAPDSSDVQLAKYLKPKLQKTVLESSSLHHLMHSFKKTDGNKTPANFLKFCKNHLTGKVTTSVFNRTSQQSSSSLWHEVRYGRITASIFYEVSRCKTEGQLVEQIMGATAPFSSEAIQRGQRLEKEVLKVVEQQRRIKSFATGIQLSSEHPIFGASPDGLSKEFCIEIKCPSKQSTIKRFISEDLIITKKYLSQINLQMHLCGRKKGLFCVALPNFETNKEVTIIEVVYDSDLVNNQIAQCEQFWIKYIFPVFFQD